MNEFFGTKNLIYLRGNWLAILKPLKFDAEHLQLNECRELIDKCQVSLRGWNYPHYHSQGDLYGGISPGVDHIQSVTQYKSKIEIRRFYQSCLFVHRFAFQEEEKVFEILPVLYRVTEIFQFASNLMMNDIFGDDVEIKITLYNMKNRELTFSDPRRELHDRYRCQVNELPFTRKYSKPKIISEAAECVVECTRWIFERFDWRSENVTDLLRAEQETFLKGILKT